jgi:hypothetical protein
MQKNIRSTLCKEIKFTQKRNNKGGKPMYTSLIKRNGKSSKERISFKCMKHKNDTAKMPKKGSRGKQQVHKGTSIVA